MSPSASFESASWNQPRSDKQLEEFILRRESALAETEE